MRTTEGATELRRDTSLRSLREVIDLHSWFDVRRAADIAVGILEALSTVDRDATPFLGLRPETVLLSDSGDVLLNRLVDIDAGWTWARAAYQSPEEISGGHTDIRSAFYTLGIILYEMLTDRVPFEGSECESIRRKHLCRKPEPPQVFRSDLPDALSGLVLRLLEKKPADRPQDAGEIVAELRAIVHAEEQPAGQTTLLEAIDGDDILSLGEMSLPESHADAAIAGKAMPHPEPVPAWSAATIEPAVSNDVALAEPFPSDTALDPHTVPASAASEHNSSYVERTAKPARRSFEAHGDIAIEPRSRSTAAALDTLPRVPLKYPRSSRPEFRVPMGSAEPRARWVFFSLIAVVVAAAFILYLMGQRTSAGPDNRTVPNPALSKPGSEKKTETPATAAVSTDAAATPGANPTNLQTQSVGQPFKTSRQARAGGQPGVRRDPSKPVYRRSAYVRKPHSRRYAGSKWMRRR